MSNFSSKTQVIHVPLLEQHNSNLEQIIIPPTGSIFWNDWSSNYNLKL